MSLFSRRVDKQLEAYQRELVDTHYKEVENMYRQIRGWRHDYRNHIQVLKAFAAKGDMDAIRAYLDELDTDLNTVDTVVKTGNAMADAILNSKISLAKSRGITVQADAHIPVKLKMSELDLCCILGNLFDNAIEASMALPAHPRVHGHEGNAALYLLHKLHRRKEARKDRRALPHHEGRGARLWSRAHRRYRRAAGRVSLPQQRGRRVHDRDTAPAGVSVTVHPRK